MGTRNMKEAGCLQVFRYLDPLCVCPASGTQLPMAHVCPASGSRAWLAVWR